MTISAPSTGSRQSASMSLREDSPAKTSPSQADARASTESDPDCSGSSSASSNAYVQNSLLLKMSPDSSVRTGDEIWLSSSGRYRSAGRLTSDGDYWTRNISAWPSNGSVCSLSQILERDVHPKYWLTQKGCKGILRRAEKRGKTLPERLRSALAYVASQPTDAPEPDPTGR